MHSANICVWPPGALNENHLKAISLWAPWGSLVADGHKHIETRHWRPPDWLVGQRLAIHQAKKIDKHFAYQCGYGANGILCPLGAVVAIVFLESWMQFTAENTEHISDEEKRYGDFYPGRFGWVFTDVKKLKEPVPFRGHQSIFDWPEGVVK